LRRLVHSTIIIIDVAAGSEGFGEVVRWWGGFAHWYIDIPSHQISQKIIKFFFGVASSMFITAKNARGSRRFYFPKAQHSVLVSHPLLYARIPRNRQKVRQFGVFFPIPKLVFEGNHEVKE